MKSERRPFDAVAYSVSTWWKLAFARTEVSAEVLPGAFRSWSGNSELFKRHNDVRLMDRVSLLESQRRYIT
jgi:hypothetical protein